MFLDEDLAEEDETMDVAVEAPADTSAGSKAGVKKCPAKKGEFELVTQFN